MLRPLKNSTNISPWTSLADLKGQSPYALLCTEAKLHTEAKKSWIVLAIRLAMASAHPLFL